MTSHSVSDQELVAASLADSREFSVLIERYEASLRRYLKRLGCSNDSDCDDILQEIFIKVFRYLNEYDPDLKFSSWLYRIAHNETMSFFRKERSRPRVLSLNAEDTELFFEQIADSDNAIELARKRDDARIIRDLIARLDPRYQEVLILRFLEERSYAEISDILHIPEGTVATFLNRGKKELQRALTANGIHHL